jgi:hypothetical protein
MRTYFLLLLLNCFWTAYAEDFVTFTNPVARNTTFGWKVVAAGPERVLLGDWGAVYLFTTNATHLQTFVSPVSETSIRDSFSMVGTNHFIAGAPGPNRGAALLYRLDGTLIKTFYPVQRYGDFGVGVAGIGEDRVAISSTGPMDIWGRVELFHTNGTLLTTITNPDPQGVFFGRRLLIRGSDTIYTAGYDLNTGVGSVYRYDTNGLLQRIYRLQHPVHGDTGSYAFEPLDNGRLAVNGENSTKPFIYVFEEDGTLAHKISSVGFVYSLRSVNNALLFGSTGVRWVRMLEHCGDLIRDFTGPGQEFGQSIDIVDGGHVLISSTGSDGGYVRLYFNATDRVLLPLAESDFSTDSDGWSGAPKSADWDSTTGSMSVSAMSLFLETNVWVAPPKFLGNKSAAYNGKLQFDQRSSTLPDWEGQALLSGAGFVIIHPVEPPSTNFSTRSVELYADGWTHLASGAPVTQLEFLSILSRLDRLEIRAEFVRHNIEGTALDNVRLLSPQSHCEPNLRADSTDLGIKLEWPANAREFSLYRSMNLSDTNRTRVTTEMSEANGVLSATEPQSSSPAFYYLSKP